MQPYSPACTGSLQKLPALPGRRLDAPPGLHSAACGQHQRACPAAAPSDHAGKAVCSAHRRPAAAIGRARRKVLHVCTLEPRQTCQAAHVHPAHDTDAQHGASAALTAPCLEALWASHPQTRVHPPSSVTPRPPHPTKRARVLSPQRLPCRHSIRAGLKILSPWPGRSDSAQRVFVTAPADLRGRTLAHNTRRAAQRAATARAGLTALA